MKKLLVLALLGLGLGAGAWKAQHPEGTLDDFRDQAQATVQRLQKGVDTVLEAKPSGTQETEQAESSVQDALTVRLDALESGLQSLKDAQSPDSDAADPLSGINEALSEARTEAATAAAGNEASIVRLDAVDSRLDLLVRRLDEQTIDTQLDTLRNSLQSATEEARNQRTEAIARQTSIDNELANLTDQSAALGLRLDTLNSVAAATDSDNTDGTEDTQSPAMLALNTSIDKRFTALESRLSTVNADSRQLATLTEQLNEADEQIKALQTSNAEIERSLGQINESIDSLRTVGESLSIDTVQDEIRDQLALLQSQIESDSNDSNTQGLESLLDTTRSRIQTLEQRVQDLPASSSEADNAQQIQSALQSQIVALERRLETMNSTDPALASTLSNVKEQVDQLAAKEFVTQEDLRAQKETKAVQYKIYFDRNSVEITADAALVLDSFIAQEKNRTTGVSIFGFTDRSGSATYNQQLALQRATNVRSYLIKNGFDYTKIKALNGLGEDAAAAVLPDNADDAQQRVVVLYASQQP